MTSRAGTVATPGRDYESQAALRLRGPPGDASRDSLRRVGETRGPAAREAGDAVAMPMKGRFPIRRTLQYLNRGDVVFKESVKVMTVNYNTHGELGEGARSVWVPPGGVRGKVDAVEAIQTGSDRNPSATPP